MSDISDLKQQVKNLTQRLNDIASAAKKIFELPWQSVLKPDSKIHVSNESGQSEFINVQQILDAALSYRQNQLVSIGTISVSGNNVTIPAGAQWIINNVNYSNPSSIVINVPYAEEGNTRTDIIVADTFNTMYRINGPESAGISPAPNKPINTVLITTIDVTDSTIGDTPPVIGSDYELISHKNQPDGYAGLNSSGKVITSLLPSYVDDVLEGYLLSNVFYTDSAHTIVIPAETGKIYVDITTGQNNKQYRYSGSAYIQITNGLIASTNDVPEGSTNLYFTTARVLATALSGLSVLTGGAIVSTDTILIAFGKIQKQITDLTTTVSGKQVLDAQIEIGANVNVQNSWHGQTILFTSTCTITVPSTLNASLMFPFRTLTGVTVTWAITSPFTWETTPVPTTEKTTGHFMRRGSTNTIMLDV